MTDRWPRPRRLVVPAVAGLVGWWGLQTWPWPAEHPLIAWMAAERPALTQGFSRAYGLLWFTTPFLAGSLLASLGTIFLTRVRLARGHDELPPYPAPDRRQELFLVLGEQHHRTTPGRARRPQWLCLPERGLYTGVVVIGATGSGKSAGAMFPFVEQLLAYRANRAGEKVSGLVLEVKGDFCDRIKGLLKKYDRQGDYVEVGLESPYRYNPLHNDLDAYSLAYSIATLMTNLFGRGKEPFWQQASTNLVKFVILLHKVLDDYVTLRQVYEHAINPDLLRARIAEGEVRFASRRIVIDLRDGPRAPNAAWTGAAGDESWAPWSEDLVQALSNAGVAHRVRDRPHDEQERAERFEAVKRWFDDDWMRMEAKLRTSIVEGVSVFLSLFDDNPKVRYTFCPPKDAYDASKNADGHLGTPLPPLAQLIEQGTIVAFNVPEAQYPGLARALGTMLKQDFQRAVLNRVPRLRDQRAQLRPTVFICDEYQAFATSGEQEPSGDEKFFSLARQSRCIPIVATQSISSLRSTLPGETWRTLLQGLRTKVFLTLSDDFSAHMAAELCGTVERLKPSYTLTEAGQDARVSLLTGRPAAHRTTVSATKAYTLKREYVFEPKVFSELPNAHAIVLAYDGERPCPPTYCYLKLDYLDPQVSVFDHETRRRS